MARECRMFSLKSLVLVPCALLLFPVLALAQAKKGSTDQDVAKQRELAKQVEVLLRAGDHGDCAKKITFSIKSGAVSKQQCVHDCFGTFNTAMVDLLDWSKSKIRMGPKAGAMTFVEIPCRSGLCVVSESGPYYGAHPGTDSCGSPLERNTGAQDLMSLQIPVERADELLALVTQIR